MSPPPVGRFSPSYGITIDRSPTATRISGTMEVYGPLATPVLALSLEQAINRFWTKTFVDGSSVSCSVKLVYKAPGTQSTVLATSIEVNSLWGPSRVRPGLAGNQMKLDGNDPNIQWVVAHEFGHIIGLEDKYSESVFSKLSGAVGGPRTNTIQPGYRGNVMGQHQGNLFRRNITDLAKETAPWFWNEDDQVRDWIANNKTAVATLPTATKIEIIRVLASGAIEADDLAAIETVLKSVRTKAEADSIRLEFNATAFVQLGGMGASPEQRTLSARVYRAFTGMPK